jgi:HJR/Mrr/RecB family endonuclease
MTASPYQDYYDYLADHVITPFYNQRLTALQSLNLQRVLKRRNPYLLKAKNVELAGDLVKGIVDPLLASQEETIFGNLLEGFAIFVSSRLDGGFKSERKGLDLEFRRGGSYFIVGIKSGPNWGNIDQVNRMKDNFKEARISLRSAGVKEEIVAVNGCLYGEDRNPLKRDADPDKTYFKYCGRGFWEFVSGDPNLYREIIISIDKAAREKDENFKRAYNAKVSEMAEDFVKNFMTAYEIDWIKLVDSEVRRIDAPTLVLKSLLLFKETTDEGKLIESVSIPWFNIIETLRRDPDAAFSISDRQWEEIIAGAYHRAGFEEVTLTPRSGDYGRDVIAVKRGIGTIRIIDQVKAYKPGHLVDANDVRALVGVLHGDGASKGFLTTTADFAPRLRSDPLITPFMPSRLELVNGKTLLKRLIELRHTSST